MLDWLFDRFSRAGSKEALLWNDRAVTYAELLAAVKHWRTKLAEHGVRAGSGVSLEGDYSPTSIGLLLALIDLRAVAVPLTATVEERKPWFRQVAEVQLVVRVHASDEVTFEPRDASLQNELLAKLRASGHPGLVVFSSGSTGEPKGILHDFVPLLEKFHVERHSLRTITFLLLDHLGGINTLLYILSNAGTIVTIDDRNPDAVCAAIARHKVELLPTSPTFLNLMLLSESYKRHDLTSLKQITYGTEPMPESTLRRLHELFPGVSLLQTYGLTELGVMRSKSKSADSLLVKVGGEGFETKVQNGTLWIRARSAMLGYLNAPSPFDAEGWMDTGDEVIVEGDYMRILGRRSELINVGGEKVYPAEVESVLLEIDGVLDAAVRGERNPISGMMVVAKLTLAQDEDPVELRKRVRSFCQARLAPFKVPAKIEAVTDPLHSPRFKRVRR